MSNIVRITDGSIDGIATRTVSGFFIFAINDVPVPTDQDPRVVCLRAIARQRQAAGHLGTITLNDMCENYAATDTFMSTKLEATEFVATCYGIDEGDFYTFGAAAEPGGFIVPTVDERFWQLGFPEGESDDMEYVIRRGSAGLYIDPFRQTSVPSLLISDIAPVPGGYRIEPSVWMERVLDNFQTAVVVGHDGVTLDAYARTLDDFAYLQIGIDEAEQSILSNPWFQENVDNLVWNDFDECLKLPQP